MSDTRRDFVKAAAGMSLVASATAPADVPRRKLGQTGLEGSIVGLGGARVGTLREEAVALRTIRHSCEVGINYFDSAPAGTHGLRQQRYGIALQGVPREHLSCGTKTRHRTYGHAELDLNQSLANFNTDYLDLYQVHNVMHAEDIDFALGPRGVLEMIDKARQAGKIRYVGFAGHMDPRVLAKMLDAYDWDSVLMPLSVTDGADETLSFERTTLPLAVKKGIGVMAMKVTGVGVLHTEGTCTLGALLDYVWSLPIVRQLSSAAHRPSRSTKTSGWPTRTRSSPRARCVLCAASGLAPTSRNWSLGRSIRAPQWLSPALPTTGTDRQILLVSTLLRPERESGS